MAWRNVEASGIVTTGESTGNGTAEVRVEIRKASVEEAGALSALAFASKASWGYPRAALELWREQLRITAADIAAKPVYVGSRETTIVGFHSLAPGDGQWELDNLFVAPAFTRRGYGRALLEHALLIAFQGGAAMVLVDADPHAEAFYRHCGAIGCGEVPAPIPGEPGRVRPQLFFELKRRPSPGAR